MPQQTETPQNHRNTPVRHQDRQTQADGTLGERFAIERRRQLLVLWALAAIALVVSVLRAGVHTVFPSGWWHIDLPK